jgi:replicative DNA helicase
LHENEWDRLEDGVTEMQDVPLFIDDTPALRVLDFRARARRLVRQHGVEFIVVDYLQLMRAERRVENRAVEVAMISSGIKALAREAEVPVMAIAQLNRRVEQENRYPRMSDLRESGAIEQDADAILLLHRPTDPTAQEAEADGPVADDIADGTKADLLLAKQRNGPTGMARFVFFGQYLRFEPRASQGPGP